MIENDIKRLVEEHYADAEADVLLLSNLGMRLTKAGLWPPPNDNRQLIEAAEATTDVTVVRDETAKSFITIVRTGDEQRAVRAIANRQKRYFLRGLPRALLLAFTLDMAEGQVMALRLGPKITYIGGPAAEEGSIVVDQDLRLPGLDALDVTALSETDVERLETNIKAWCERHEVDPASLIRLHSKSGAAKAPVVAPAQSSALERLYAAQEPDVAKRLSVPIDIALALSRMP